MCITFYRGPGRLCRYGAPATRSHAPTNDSPPPGPEASNPYHEGDLIFVMTTPPERTSKLAPLWKGPFVIQRVPNAYQLTYEDDMVWRTVHVNHVKPAKTPAGGFPVPMSPPAPPSLPPMYLSRNLTWRKPAKPPQPAAPTEGSPQPAAPVAEPPSQLPRLTQSHLPRVGPPHAHQPMRIRPLALSSGHQPLLGGPMRIRGWIHLCDALRGSRHQPCI